MSVPPPPQGPWIGDSAMPSVATRDHHPSTLSHRSSPARRAARTVRIPTDEKSVELSVGGKTVTLTNLGKPFWPELGITKGDLLQYYADVAPVLLPHIQDRAMVM